MSKLNDGGDLCLLLIDDVSVFLSLGVSATEIHDFIHYFLVNVCTQDKVWFLVSILLGGRSYGLG